MKRQAAGKPAFIFLGFPPLFMTYDPAPGFSLALIPARPTSAIGAETRTILELALPHGLPTGTWQWAAVLARPDLSELSEIAGASFIGRYRHLDLERWGLCLHRNCRCFSRPFVICMLMLSI